MMMSKYDKVALEIETYIERNQLQTGAQLNNIEELISTYNVSRSTILKALNKLETKGIIYQVQGSGIFIRKRKKKNYMNFLENHGFTSDLNLKEKKTHVLKVEIIKPNNDIVENLNCSFEDEIYSIKRLHFLNDKCFCYETSFYNKSIIPYLNKEICEGSIFSHIKNTFNIQVGFSDKYLQADFLPADISIYFELTEKDPGLFVSEIFYSTNGIAFDYSKKIYNYQNAHFFIQSQLS